MKILVFHVVFLELSRAQTSVCMTLSDLLMNFTFKYFHTDSLEILFSYWLTAYYASNVVNCI